MLRAERYVRWWCERISSNTSNNNHSLISRYAADVQYSANSKAGIRIKAQTADPDQERIDGIVNIVSGKYRYDDIAYMLDEPVITFGQAEKDFEKILKEYGVMKPDESIEIWEREEQENKKK